MGDLLRLIVECFPSTLPIGRLGYSGDIESVYRRAGGRYRNQIYFYAHHHISDKFKTFAQTKALVRGLSRDGTPMPLFSGDHWAGNKEIYARTLIARILDGEAQEAIPDRGFPPASKTSGALSTIHIKKQYIGDVVNSRAGFRYTLLPRDGANTIKAASLILFTVLHTRRTILCLTHICDANLLNNSPKCGFGCYSYGDLLRTAHGVASVRNWNVATHVDRLRPGDFPMAPILPNDTDQEYIRAL